MARMCRMLTRMPPLLAKIVGTKLGTRESILRKSRGSRPCSEQRRDFLNTPEVLVADPRESKMVHRSIMSGDNCVVPSPANAGGSDAAELCGGADAFAVDDAKGEGVFEVEASALDASHPGGNARSARCAHAMLADHACPSRMLLDS